MKVSSIFSHPIVKSHFKSEKDCLLVNHLDPKEKDRVNLSDKSKMLSILKQQYSLKTFKKLASDISSSADYKTPFPYFNQEPPQLPTNELKPPTQKPELPPTPPYKRIPEPWWFNPAPEPLPFEGNPPVRIPELPWIGTPILLPPGEHFAAPFENFQESIKQDIADKLSVPVKDINIIDYQEGYWPDSSMGNSQPGFFYAQVITPGYRITISVDDKPACTYNFYAILDHSGDELRAVVSVDPPWQDKLTEKPEQPFPMPPPADIPIQPPPTVWDTLLETVKNNPALKAFFKNFLERIKSSPASFLFWKAQVENIPGLKAFWEEIEKLQ
ncbi:MAG: hypothetical protein JRI26_11775 [Deltaproteobacteria bacterium]|nr:hypothetical protein [Deltaproteobacteria bacterium]